MRSQMGMSLTRLSYLISHSVALNSVRPLLVVTHGAPEKGVGEGGRWDKMDK
jgi:hypothetical protein